MKATYFLLALTALLLSSAAPVKPAESAQYRQAALHDPAFRPTEKISLYRTYNFAPLLLTDAVNGFIGPNYQRLQLKLLSIRQDTANLARYYLTGKAKVQGHISSFSGTLVLRQARELRRLAPNGEAASEATMRAFKSARREGFVLGDYELRENPDQLQNGIFRGVARVNWYVDKNNRLHYDYVYGEGDGFCNNQFVGTWTGYATQKSLRCNWGDFRIPNSGDFDMGAGEFSPNPKYYANGWQYYAAIYGSDDVAHSLAEQQERRSWWK